LSIAIGGVSCCERERERVLDVFGTQGVSFRRVLEKEGDLKEELTVRCDLNLNLESGREDLKMVHLGFWRSDGCARHHWF
jgi:hypothetical protein